MNDGREYRGARNNPVNKSKPIVVLSEDSTGRNELFFDLVKEKVFSCEEFVALIKKGEYPGYTVKAINGVLTPVSKPDNRKSNNLS